MAITRSIGYGGTLLAFASVWQITVPDRVLGQAVIAPAPSQAWVNARVDSLVQVALTSADRRSQAVLGIAKFGEWWMLTQRDVTAPPPEVRYPGIVARLARIYRQTDDYSVRGLIMGFMIHQAERTEAVAFLAEVAKQPADPPPPAPPGVGLVWDDTRFPLQYHAIGTLTYLGPEGRAALERLHAEGTVREPTARVYLDTLANHGFQVTPRD